MDAVFGKNVTDNLRQENEQLKEANTELECERAYLKGQIGTLTLKLEKVEKMIRQGVIK